MEVAIALAGVVLLIAAVRRNRVARRRRAVAFSDPRYLS
jgi:hypothetical protein